jgi:hypothetical protein
MGGQEKMESENDLEEAVLDMETMPDIVIAVCGGKDITLGGPPALVNPVKDRVIAAVGIILAYRGDAPMPREFKNYVKAHGLKITIGNIPEDSSFRIVSLTEFVMRPELIVALEAESKLAGKIMSAVTGMKFLYKFRKRESLTDNR